MRGGSLLMMLALASVVQPLPAQFARGERVGLSPASGVADRERPQIAMPRDGNESYWKEGGAVTALITVIAMNIWVRDVSSSQRVFGTLALGGVFFVPGALIGGQIKKD